MNRNYRVYLLMLVLAILLIGCAGAEPDVVERNTNEQYEVDTGSSDNRGEPLIVESTRLVEVEVEKVVEVVVEREVSAESSGSSASYDAEDAMVEEPAESYAPQPTQVPQALAPEQRQPDTMIFDDTDVNPFVLTIDDNLSTFAIDVDTGSYTLMRSYLDDYRAVPPRDSVRVEEYINFFDQDYAAPGDEKFAIHIEGAPAPYADNDKYHLVRVGIKGYEVPEDERPPVLLIFVIDTSGSMDRDDRLGLAKDSLELLVGELHPDDRIGIVEYGSNANVILSPTAVRDRRDIMRAIDGLRPGGSTNVDGGIESAYRMANRYRLDGEEARLIVLSDGVANVGATTPEMILENARRGISLSTFGFGMGNYNDALMEQLANQGDGSYAYIDTLRQAQKVFVKNLSGTLLTIAKDAKIQVDFNPDVVEQYRLIGYENREVADNDFRNDTVDAGEIGSGHSVTALYEVRLRQAYDEDAEALTVQVRFEDTEAGRIRELHRSIAPESFATQFSEASPTFQLSAVVAEYAELLKGSYWARDNSLTTVWNDAMEIGRLFPRDNDVAEFIDLVETAAAYVD